MFTLFPKCSVAIPSNNFQLKLLRQWIKNTFLVPGRQQKTSPPNNSVSHCHSAAAINSFNAKNLANVRQMALRA
jgi:hypothetical protein